VCAPPPPPSPTQGRFLEILRRGESQKSKFVKALTKTEIASESDLGERGKGVYLVRASKQTVQL